MRSIFRTSDLESKGKAIEKLADWFYEFSDCLDYDTASYKDAVNIAQEFLKQENPQWPLNTHSTSNA